MPIFVFIWSSQSASNTFPSAWIQKSSFYFFGCTLKNDLVLMLPPRLFTAMLILKECLLLWKRTGFGNEMCKTDSQLPEYQNRIREWVIHCRHGCRYTWNGLKFLPTVIQKCNPLEVTVPPDKACQDVRCECAVPPHRLDSPLSANLFNQLSWGLGKCK